MDSCGDPRAKPCCLATSPSHSRARVGRPSSEHVSVHKKWDRKHHVLRSFRKFPNSNEATSAGTAAALLQSLLLSAN